MFYLFLFVASFIVAFIFYKRQRPQWKLSILFPKEQLLYEQSKTTVNTIGSDGVRHGMAWSCVRVTNKRIFFLYPDKKAISKILDFSGEKQSTLDEILYRNTLYLDRVSIKVESDIRGHESFLAKAVDRNGAAVQYQFLVRESKKLKEALDI